jgi:hypothetical protein
LGARIEKFRTIKDRPKDLPVPLRHTELAADRPLRSGRLMVVTPRAGGRKAHVRYEAA